MEEAGSTVTTQRGHGSMITNVIITTPTSLDELRALADQLDERVWFGDRQVETAAQDQVRCHERAIVLR